MVDRSPGVLPPPAPPRPQPTLEVRLDVATRGIMLFVSDGRMAFTLPLDAAAARRLSRDLETVASLQEAAS